MRKTLAILSVTEVLALVAALAAALVRIGDSLTRTEKNLANVTMGVRAIDSQTAPLEEHITNINAGLTAVGEGLGSVDHHLSRVDNAVSQE
jgi:septal ring factor EnvC (AmiA/AmiB activator)